MPSIADIIAPQVSRGVSRVFAEQLRIAQSHRLRRSGHLIQALYSPSFSMSTDPQSASFVQAAVPLYLRFLDMKAHGNHRIYNRVLYGILGETRRNIIYGFTDETLQTIRQQLLQAGATLAQSGNL